MKAKYTPAMAVLLTLAMASALLPGIAQLPPTNMGKYVHQPGDNQYSNQAQNERHGAPAPVQVQMPIQSQAPAGYTPAPAPIKPDPTLDPIAADEPIPPPGFPPLPDRLDLFGSSSGGGGGGGGGNAWAAGGGGGYGGGGYSGPSPGMAGGGGAPSPTYHQHYGHMAPGAYLPNQGGGGGGGGGGGSSYRAASPGMPGGNGGSSGSSYRAINPGMPAGANGGFYKATSPGADQYSASTGGPAPPRYTGASPSDFKSLGREPKLNERDDQQGLQAPEAPTPVVVSQSSTQDLSLPEDEFSYRHPNAAKNNMKRTMTRMIKAPLNSVGGIAGVRF